MSQIRRAYKSQ